MRLFTALDLSAPALEELGRLQGRLKEQVPGRRWQALENAHLTLHFLGEVEESRLPELGTLLRQACAPQAPFALTLGQLGCFGSPSHPRVLWLSVVGEIENLHALERVNHEPLEAQGFLHEKRRYAPHITLCREPHGPIDLRVLNAEFGAEPISWAIAQVQLYHSTLTPKGPIYRLLESYPLEG